MLDTLESFLSIRRTVFKSPAQQGLCLAYFETLEVHFVHTNSFPAVLGSTKDMPERKDVSEIGFLSCVLYSSDFAPI